MLHSRNHHQSGRCVTGKEKLSKRGGGGEKREIRGKGKDGGTNKVHRRGWRDSRW